MGSLLEFKSHTTSSSWAQLENLLASEEATEDLISQGRSRRQGCERHTSPANTKMKYTNTNGQIQMHKYTNTNRQIQKHKKQCFHLDVIIWHVQLLTHRRCHVVPIKKSHKGSLGSKRLSPLPGDVLTVRTRGRCEDASQRCCCQLLRNLWKRVLHFHCCFFQPIPNLPNKSLGMMGEQVEILDKIPTKVPVR